MKARVLRAYKMMMDFYGVELCDETTGELRRREDTWQARFAHLNRLWNIKWGILRSPLTSFSFKAHASTYLLSNIKRAYRYTNTLLYTCITFSYFNAIFTNIFSF